VRYLNICPGSSSVALASTSALLVLALWGLAFAEQASPAGQPSSAQKLPKAEVAPRGERKTRDIKYGDWNKFCSRTPGTGLVCRTTISGTWDTGQSAVRADLIERQGDGEARLQLFLPVGLYLQAGVELSVDQGAPYRIPYVWCLTNACIAARVADPKLVQEMELGKALQIEVVDSNVLTISTVLPLDHFATVHKGAPLQTFEHEIDE
jgi:invasion protein IalB